MLKRLIAGPLPELILFVAAVLCWLGAASTAPEIRGPVPISGWQTGLPSPESPFVYAPAGQVSVASFQVRPHPGGPARVLLLPDDCIEKIQIAGRAFEPSELVPGANWCDFGTGIVVDLSPYLEPGGSWVTITVRNAGGPHGVDLRQLNSDIVAHPVFIAGLAALMAGLWRAGRKFGFSAMMRCALMAGVILRVVYLSDTGYLNRTHDVGGPGGHLDYVHYVAQHWSAPAKDSGWQYHHPVFYYATAAMALRLCQVLDVPSSAFVLQCLSLLFSVGFLVAAGCVVREVLEPGAARSAAFSLICFWPGGIIHSIRLGNDVLSYLFGALTLLFCVRAAAPAAGSWIPAALSAALAMVTKSTGVISAGLVLCSQLLTLGRRAWRPALIACGILAVAVVLNLSENFACYMEGRCGDLFLGTSWHSLNHHLVVGRDPVELLLPDLESLASSPFISPFVDSTGRRHFWNYLIKSALFGEFNFRGQTAALLAQTMTWLLLPLCAALVCGVFAARHGVAARIALLHAGLSLAAIFYYRARFPGIANAADFRYIFPVLISLAVLAGLGMRRPSTRLRRGVCIAAMISTAAFCACSAIFFCSAV